jgi:hypothetical protein
MVRRFPEQRWKSGAEDKFKLQFEPPKMTRIVSRGHAIPIIIVCLRKLLNHEYNISTHSPACSINCGPAQ